jgi:hypothetical protein
MYFNPTLTSLDVALFYNLVPVELRKIIMKYAKFIYGDPRLVDLMYKKLNGGYPKLKKFYGSLVFNKKNNPNLIIHFETDIYAFLYEDFYKFMFRNGLGTFGGHGNLTNILFPFEYVKATKTILVQIAAYWNSITNIHSLMQYLESVFRDYNFSVSYVDLNCLEEFNLAR